MTRMFSGLRKWAPVALVGALAMPLAGAPAVAAEIEGFRSAKFGMNEAQVRQAIARDFKLTGKKVSEGRNLAEKTIVLVIRVDDLLPGSGRSQVTYTLGYKTKGLIQVDVLFGQPLEKELSSKELWANAVILRRTLAQKGFDKDQVVVNKPTARPGLVLLFRGVDREGRTAALLGGFKVKKAKDPKDKPVLDAIRSIRLSYILNIKDPDVFRTKKEDF